MCFYQKGINEWQGRKARQEINAEGDFKDGLWPQLTL
jgi:hypothetical protein